MSTKILCDCIATSDLSRCSSFIQFRTWIKWMLEKRDDVFFYVLIPDWEYPEGELEWLMAGFPEEKVSLIRQPQTKDRTKEYVRMNEVRDYAIAFNGSHWDFDILLTVRTGLVPLYKMLMHRPGAKGLHPTKEVWVIEEMPLMSSKKSVAQLDSEVQDHYTMMGHLYSDRSMIVSYHEKADMLECARRQFQPSAVRKMDQKMKQVITVQNTTISEKDPEKFFRPGSNQQFCISFVGRLPKTGGGFEETFEIMEKQWIIRPEDTIRCIVSTVSLKEPSGVKIPSNVEMLRPPREEFWRMAKEEMHVGLLFFTDGGFSLSLMEPIFLGTPWIVLDRPHVRGMLGDSYPFFVKNVTEAYAWVSSFYYDYEKTYALFRKWREEWMIPEYTKRFKEDLLYNVLDGYLEDYERKMEEISPKLVGKGENLLVKELVGPDELVVFDRIKELAKNGSVESLASKLSKRDRDNRSLTFSTEWNEFRLGLKLFHGYEDASTTVGHLRRKKT